MLHPSIPSRPFDEETESNLKHAKYLLTLNEPENENNGNITAIDAASFWPQVVAIAKGKSTSIYIITSLVPQISL